MSLKIIIDNKIPFIQGALEPVAEVQYLAGAATTKSDVTNADALITRTRTKCNSELLQGSKVKYIASATIGFDHIDTKFCSENNIEWTNAPGCNSGSVGQYLGSLFALLYQRHQLDYSQLTLGVIGVGNVGSKAAKIGEALGMKVLKNDPPKQRKLQEDGKDQEAAEYCELQEVIDEADIITLHVPLQRTGSDTTFHLFDDSMLEKLASRKKRFLINTSRGEVIDNAALKKVLQKQSYLRTILDVWESEPDLDLELQQLLELGTPHIAGYSADGKSNGTLMSIQALNKFFNLGLDDWKPDVPTPENNLLQVDSNLSATENLLSIFHQTYQIEKDDERLRKNPEKFEYLRGSYPIRRELCAYTIPADISEELKQKLEQLPWVMSE